MYVGPVYAVYLVWCCITMRSSDTFVSFCCCSLVQNHNHNFHCCTVQLVYHPLMLRERMCFRYNAPSIFIYIVFMITHDVLNTHQVSASFGEQFYLQADTPQMMNDWYSSLQASIKKIVSTRMNCWMCT